MKRGFSLIEIIVVIVILGILATVGVPKLFVSIAKAKASEVPVAASSYIKLQDTYFAEKIAMGSWKLIGYSAPNNGAAGNFCYSEGTTANDSENGEEETGATPSVIGWGARAMVTLNECGAGSWWSVVVTPSEKGAITYERNVSYAPCTNLTANWNIGRTFVGNCESAGDISNKNKNDNSDSKTPDEAKDPQQPQQQSQQQTQQSQQQTQQQSQQPQQSQQQAQKAVQEAKQAFNSCNSNCTKEERDRLKQAWDNEKEKCKQLYGNAVCE